MNTIRLATGAVFLLCGLGWIVYQLWYFVRLNLGLEPSWDIALYYWYPFACCTFPFAFVAVGMGEWMLKGKKEATVHKS